MAGPRSGRGAVAAVGFKAPGSGGPEDQSHGFGAAYGGGAGLSAFGNNAGVEFLFDRTRKAAAREHYRQSARNGADNKCVIFIHGTPPRTFSVYHIGKV